MHYLVAYDIVHSRRRRKVMEALKDYGLRVQYSVFECDLNPPGAAAMAERILKLINPRKDRVHIYPLCDACFFRSESLGREAPSRELPSP
jgi:CRISPR-associated protein Cas2